ncbi:histidine kinase [Ramlibacter sp. USB13]|uniref:Histidine kinase n=1 Tax=Ramlibacter cellulosilyticus TaxID=2764187 RepID=A0A923SA74_9BURK|nr:histidine kinase [Ramlibacter cellulosilyticus]MBC5781948.1 histidine kinase [Ramlibacter cellulosilyticus]
MDDSQLLSAFQELSRPEATAKPRPRMAFDVCQTGVVLRVVLFVEGVLAVAAVFGSGSVTEWLQRFAVTSGAAVPVTAGWLLLTCASERLLARLPSAGQQAFCMALGAIAGLTACALLSVVGMLGSPPWLGGGLAGALLAGVVVTALVLRDKGRMPAETAARLAELQARIRPHFLFNSLNSAIALVREEPARAEHLLEDLSELFRHVLVAKADAATLAEEVQVARHYLDIEQVRFGERLRVQWSIDPDAGKARVPALFLQPLVENAVKHGVEPSPTGADVKVTTQKRGSVVVIKVTNTVPAGQGKPGHGVALDNVRDRLRLLHDVQAQFQTALIDGRYQVRMEVPA